MPQAAAVAFKAPVRIPFIAGANAGIADTFIFTADADYDVVSVIEVHDAAGSDGGSVTLDLLRCASGTTIASGTSVLASTFDLKSTADTPVEKTASNAGLAASPTRILLDGESLGLNFGGTLTRLTGIAVTVTLNPVSRPSW